MSDLLSGGCQCGAVRYDIDSAHIQKLYCCHCTECRRQSSSAFGMSLIINRVGFDLRQGILKTWQRGTDSGNINRGHFCPECGVRIFHDGGAESGTISVKGGSLDNINELRPISHIWTKRALPWLNLSDSGIPCAPGEPEED